MQFVQTRAQSKGARKLASILLGGASAAVFLTTPAFAQDAPADAPIATSGGDIIVSARRRDERLMDVPVSVAAISAETIENKQINDVSALGDTIPNVQIVDTSSGSGAALNIRGMGSAGIDSGIAQSVATVVDGTMLSQGSIVNLGLFDLQQVEVMKGPQALFFGKNSPSGVISFTSRNPGDRWEVNGRAAYEAEGLERVVEAGVGGPITDTLGVRLALKHRKADGHLKNHAQDSFDPLLGVFIPGASDSRGPKSQELTGRLTVDWQPTENFRATAKLLGSMRESNGDAFTYTTICPPGQTTPSSDPGGIAFPDPYEKCFNGKENTLGDHALVPPSYGTGVSHFNNGQPFNDNYYKIASLKLDYDFNNMTLTSQSSFTKLDTVALDNFSGATFFWYAGENDEFYKSFSEEIRLASDFDGPLNFMMGYIFETNKLETFGHRWIAPLPVDPATGRTFALTELTRVDGETHSPFAQVSYKLTDELEASVGARYTHDKRELKRVENTYVHPALAGFLAAGNLTGDTSSENISPEATLTWHYVPDSMVYVAYKSGYKPASYGLPNVFTSLQFAGGSDGLIFQKEKAKGFEIGSKGVLMDGAIRYEATAFRFNYTDLQTSAFIPDTFSYAYNNVPKARTEGVELTVDWKATDLLTFNASGAYTKARFIEFTDSPCYQAQTVAQGCVGAIQDLSGERMPRSSDWSGSLGFTYDQPVGADYHVALYGDANYRSKTNVAQELGPLTEVGAKTLFNLGAKAGPQDNSWSVGVFGRNLTDEVFPLYANNKPGAGSTAQVYSASWQRGRELWAELRFQY